MDYAAIAEAAKKHEQPMVDFLRDIVAIEGYSGTEKNVIARIRYEVEKLGFADKITVDGLGNLLVQIGNGPRLIAIDAHVDTGGVGNPGEWKHDPFKGKVENGIVYGRGAGDQRGSVPPMVYATKIIKDLGLQSDEWSLLLTGGHRVHGGDTVLHPAVGRKGIRVLIYLEVLVLFLHRRCG